MPINIGQGSGDGPSENVGKKRRRPTPEFGVPPPFKPTTGTHATLRVEGIHPYCAMMQVAAADTYEDYLVCRGFDPRILKFIDYAAGDPDKLGISVAKPFGNRTVSKYTVGEVYPAFLPTQGAVGEGKAENYVPPSPTAVDWRVGQNAGTAPTSNPGGQPTALVDTIEELVDHNGVNVQWLLIDRGTGETEVFWGKATANWTDNGALCDHITVNPCDDCEGANPTAAVVTVLLPKANLQDPDLVTNDVLAYVATTDGSYVCVSDYLESGEGDKTYWGVAKTNWEDNGASCDSVDINPCDDCEGANPDAGTTVTVLLPKTAEQDPNVILGDVIAYVATVDATSVCSSDYLDDKIGSVKMWALGSAAIPPGWAIMNGSANAAPDGTGIDLTDRFVRASLTTGAEGGAEDHTHTVTLDILPHTVDELKVSLDHTHGITILPHSVEELIHKHPMILDTLSNGWDFSAGTADQAPLWTCTDIPYVPYDITENFSNCEGPEWGPLNHEGVVRPAYGGGTYPEQELYHQYNPPGVNRVDNNPLYTEMIFIERIDNSL